MTAIDFGGPAPVLMGIVNVTPDSFSDGGQFFDPQKAIAHGKKLVAEGATILDIGGESTRPGASPVSSAEEIARVVPVIEGLKGCGAMISIDTRHAATMRAAIAAGAGMVNDVTALTHDPESLSVVVESGVYVCLMHMKGEPQTMQDVPIYGDVVAEVSAYLRDRVAACAAAGVNRKQMVVDPGIGFGKTLDHNINLLKNLDKIADPGIPVLLGASRKRFIESLCPGTGAQDRLPGSLATVLAGWQQGVRAFRVHDVAETAQALAVFRALI